MGFGWLVWLVFFGFWLVGWVFSLAVVSLFNNHLLIPTREPHYEVAEAPLGRVLPPILVWSGAPFPSSLSPKAGSGTLPRAPWNPAAAKRPESCGQGGQMWGASGPR